jgi:hypothetical protein
MFYIAKHFPEVEVYIFVNIVCSFYSEALN